MVVNSPYHQHSPRRLWAKRGFFVVMILVVAYLIFEFGRIRADYNIIEAAADRQDYEERIGGLEKEIADLNQAIAILETNRDVDRESYNDVENQLTSLQAKIVEQRDAIAFYRGIVSPKDRNAGLRVQDLKLTRGMEEREFNLRLVLVQAMKHDRKVSGDVNLRVDGNEDGVAVSYAFGQLVPPDQDDGWSFSFRYFQDFDRQLVLPDGFTPERIVLEVQSRTRSISSIEESFAWETSQG